MWFKNKLIRVDLRFFVFQNSGLLLLIILLSQELKSQSLKADFFATWKNSSKADTLRLKALDQLCLDFYEKSNPDSALLIANTMYSFASAKHSKFFMAKALLRMAGAYQNKGDYEKKLEFEQKSLKLFKELNFVEGIAACFTRIGNSYLYFGENSRAIDFYYKALRIYEKNNDKKRIAVILVNIANVQFQIGEADTAVGIIQKCIKGFKMENDSFYLSQLFRTLAYMQYELYHTDEAIDAAKEAINLSFKAGDQSTLAQSYSILGKAYLDKKNYGLCKKNVDKAMYLSNSFGDSNLVATCLMTLSDLDHSLGNTGKAILTGKKALGILVRSGIHSQCEKISLLISDWLTEQKRYEEALEMYKFHVKERDAMKIASAKEAMAREKLKYDYEKKELTYQSTFEKKLQALQFQAERQSYIRNLWLTFSLAALVILLLFGFFAYRNFRQKTTIADQKNGLLRQQLLISQMNPHFIFNSLNAVQNFIFKSDSYQAGVYLKQFSELIRRILDFSTRDRISLRDEVDFLKNYLELQKLRFGDKLNYVLTLDPKLDVDMVVSPVMLVQPFIENAIEHGIFYKEGNGFLSVKIFQSVNSLIYEIEDDGIGLEGSRKIKNTHVMTHKSLAIELTKERLEVLRTQFKGNFEITVKDKVPDRDGSTGVYVKITTPFILQE